MIALEVENACVRRLQACHNQSGDDFMNRQMSNLEVLSNRDHFTIPENLLSRSTLDIPLGMHDLNLVSQIR